MNGFNQVQLIGHLGKDAETRHTPSGVPVSEFSIGCSEKWKDRESGEMRESTEWARCTLWRHEGVLPYLTKGQPVHVVGKLKTEEYEKDGQKRWITKVVVIELRLLNRGQGRQARDEDEPGPRSRGDLSTRDEAPPPGDEDAPF